MKKLLYSSIVLTIFSFSLILFQISCQDDAAAKNETTVQNKFLYAIYTTQWEYWIANNDGTDHHQILISLPDGLKPAGSGKLSQEGNTIIFPAFKPSTDEHYIYSVLTNGTNLKKLLDKTVAEQLDINSTF